jgi:hypothetical protein
MAEKLANEGHEVIFFDCASTWEPLMDWYETCPYEVIRAKNTGTSGLWNMRIVTELKEPFVTTDPDYDLSEIPSDWDEALVEGLARFPEHNKIGFSWDESRVPQENPAWVLDKMNKYPQGNPAAWGRKLPNNFYKYPCDTSFAVYRPGVALGIYGIRKGRPYTGIHLPWHILLEPSADSTKLSVIMDDEIAYYFSHAEFGMTKGRLIKMVAEYYKRNPDAKK